MGFFASGQAIYPLCYEFSLFLVCAYTILDVIKCMYYSKNSRLNITLLLVNIIVNTECSQSNAAGLYHRQKGRSHAAARQATNSVTRNQASRL